MARPGDSICLRGRTWWLDFIHDGRRHVARLGKDINRMGPASSPGCGAPRCSRARPSSGSLPIISHHRDSNLYLIAHLCLRTTYML